MENRGARHPGVQARMVRRAAEIAGGVEILAARLDMCNETLRKWLEGELPVPQKVLLRCVDIVNAHYEARKRAAEMRERVAEIERLLRPPLLPHHVECANRLMLTTARQARDGRVANLAMRLMSVVQESNASGEPSASLEAALARLRTAVDEAGAAKTP